MQFSLLIIGLSLIKKENQIEFEPKENFFE